MIVIFKSEPKFYEKEKRGTKPNTFRKMDSEDIRFKKLRNINMCFSGCNYPTHICIENSATHEHFIRKITDVTEYEGWMIISWDSQVLREENGEN